MAPTFSSAFRDACVNGGKALLGYVALHTGSTATAANEITGSPYARKAVSYPNASGGTGTSVTTTLDIPAGVSVGSYSVQPAATGFTPHIMDSFTPAESYANAGTCTVTIPFNVNPAA